MIEVGKKILLVEDNPLHIELMKDRLESLEYLVAVARDGDEGITLAGQLLPDAMIVDVMLPQRNGYEVCSVLKKSDATKHIPIVLISALVDEKHSELAKGNGAAAILQKPLSRAAIRSMLQSLL